MSNVLSSSNNRLFASVACGKDNGVATTGCATGSSERVYVITNARDAVDKVIGHCKALLILSRHFLVFESSLRLVPNKKKCQSGRSARIYSSCINSRNKFVKFQARKADILAGVAL
jgi:hypothetical protein